MLKKRFLIIGGSHGIGNALLKKLSTQGHEVISICRGEEVTYTCDVTDFNQSLPAIEGPINGLVYCPGTVNLKPFAQLTLDDFRNDWEVNALAAFRVIHEYHKLLMQAESASIVLFSTVAVKIGMPFHASVAAAKGAIEGMTRSLAAELSPKVRVNAIAPSLTDTPLTHLMVKTEAKKEAMGQRHPLKRVGTPEDVASMANFLLSDEASWITGQVFGVDGGMSTLKLF